MSFKRQTRELRKNKVAHQLVCVVVTAVCTLSRVVRYREYGYNACDEFRFDCRDPEVPNDCAIDTDSPTLSPAAASGYPGCEGTINCIGDGFCDSSTNNEEYGWDGGKTTGVKQMAI